MNKLNNIIWLSMLFCALSLNVSGQVKCTNKLLAELVEQLPELQNGSAKEVLVPKISKSKPIIVEKNQEGVIEHIGVKFFDRSVIQKFPSPVYHFIERYFLELLLLPSQNEMKMKMDMEHVSISSETFSMIDLREGLQNIVAGVPRDFSVYITSNNNRYSASCLDGNKMLARITFPVRYELITGFTKLEAEGSVYPELLSQMNANLPPVDASYMTAYKDGMYSANEDFFVSEDIKSNAYYNKVEEKYVPVFSPSHLEESVHNLFNTGYDWGTVVEIEQNLYGDKKNTFEIPLSKLACFFLWKKCQIYSGVRKYDKKTIEGVMMAVNMELGYQHVMMFTFDKDVFVQPSKHKIKVKMYSYVPIHNVASLF